MKATAFSAPFTLAATLFVAAPINALAQTPSAETAVAAPVASAADAPAFEPGQRGRVDLGMGFASLTGGNSSWSDQYMRGNIGLNPDTTLNWELASQRHFNERGTVGALSLTHTLSPLWYMTAGASSGSADFHNKYRADLGIYRKWTETQQWVSGLSVMRSASRDNVHRDTGATMSLAYYSTNRWVAEGGVVYNRSNPGSVDGFRGFGALTLGAEKQHYLTARIDHGKEGYLPTSAIAVNGDRVGFQSTEFSLTWRHWLAQNWGYVVGGQYYRNPYYNRKGISAAVFFDF
ncbi:MAG: YaiO family outer membrane beta-barrel protein [Comamonas sp.]